MQIKIAPESSSPKPATPAYSFAKSALQMAIAFSLCLTLSACFNGENTMDLGSVSIGQQLIDLKKARDSGSMTAEEYESAKKSILLLLSDIADDDDVNIEIEIDDDENEGEDEDEKEKEEEESSGFLF